MSNLETDRNHDNGNNANEMVSICHRADGSLQLDEKLEKGSVWLNQYHSHISMGQDIMIAEPRPSEKEMMVSIIVNAMA